ncbi:MAG: hypothetical protein LBO02_02945 [Holosporaceae bacterium]|jgi:outer membrane protein assembly factor BamE (lipoprotein component of BamABCDE complex)|nr:hypothetical protein [Holosporaceae bacterium]
MKKFFLIIGLCFLAACQPRINSRGNVVVKENLKNFAVGKTTMQDVLARCGAPSLLRGDYLWIYIGAKSEEITFGDIKLTDKFIVRMKFDANKILQSIEKVESQLKEDDNIDMNEEITGLIEETNRPENASSQNTTPPKDK